MHVSTIISIRLFLNSYTSVGDIAPSDNIPKSVKAELERVCYYNELKQVFNKSYRML